MRIFTKNQRSSDEKESAKAPVAEQMQPGSHGVRSITYLQRAAGNQAVQGLLQRKIDSASSQRPEEEKKALKGDLTTGETPPQRADDEGATENRSGIPHPLKAGLELLSGINLSGIRIHNNSSKPAQLNALAYTQGQDIHVGPGQEKHLPHEGWHAVQQMLGRVKPTIQAKGVSVNDDEKLEREADVMGAKALRNMHVNRTDNKEKISNTVSAQPNQTKAASPAPYSMRPTIQRAMKFEYQIKKDSFTNRLYRDDGTNVLLLPRKYGPEDFLVKGKSGVRLESETHGQPEFETGWTRSWSKLRAQIDEARQMTDQMNAAPKVFGSDRKEYSKFPFLESQTKHLGPGQGFKMTGGGLWEKRQKARKVRVATEQLNVRSGPGKRFREIAQLSRGEDVEVLETKGRWSRIKKGDIAGWVYNPLLRRWKWYESNKDDSGVRSDKPLQPLHEKLLVKIIDRSWTAYIQPSESFSLDQFESFLKQFRPSSEVDPVVSDVGRTMSGIDFASRSGELKNLLLMVVYYIQMGRKQEPFDPKKSYSAKWAFPLMSRTNFGSIFKSLREDEQELFKKMVKDPVNGIAASQGLAPGDRLLKFGHKRSKGKREPTKKNPTVQAWLIGITEGKDLFSGLGFPGAMGRFPVEEEVGRQKGLIRFESRRSESLQVASKWVEHAHKLFLKAMRNRSRDSGKGKTGLKFDVPPPKFEFVPKLTLKLGDKTNAELGAEFRYLFPTLLKGKLKPFVYTGIGTGGLSAGAGASVDPLTDMSLFLAGKGGIRSEWFKSIEIGGELEVGWVFDEYRSLRLGIGIGAWKNLSDDKKRAHLNLFFSKQF